MPENLNIKVGGSTNKKIKKQISLEEIISWIKGKGYDPVIIEALIKIAKKYSYAAYGQFKKNVQKHLYKIEEQRKGNKL
jgi:hypothetical protein